MSIDTLELEKYVEPVQNRMINVIMAPLSGYLYTYDSFLTPDMYCEYYDVE